MEIGDVVRAKTSFMNGEVGKIVDINWNRTLPIAVKFKDMSSEWDYKVNELEVL